MKWDTDPSKSNSRIFTTVFETEFLPIFKNKHAVISAWGLGLEKFYFKKWTQIKIDPI